MSEIEIVGIFSTDSSLNSTSAHTRPSHRFSLFFGVVVKVGVGWNLESYLIHGTVFRSYVVKLLSIVSLP